jgi:hypothetical protein
VPLLAGNIYHLEGDFTPFELLKLSSKSAKSSFAEGILLPTKTAKVMTVAIEHVKRAATLCQLHKLTAEHLVGRKERA